MSTLGWIIVIAAYATVMGAVIVFAPNIVRWLRRDEP